MSILLFSRLLRSAGDWQPILRQLLTQDKPLILEIEPPDDALTCRRKAFYERNGLQAQPVLARAAAVSGRRPHRSACHHVKPDI
ncbi:MAG: hypothetical protein ACLU3I_17775 [Acutalibacteraceae bacterium]